MQDSLVKLILEYSEVFVTVQADTNLYTDCRMDSLSYMRFLTEVEDLYDISFTLEEIEKCTQVGTLLQIVESKQRG